MGDYDEWTVLGYMDETGIIEDQPEVATMPFLGRCECGSWGLYDSVCTRCEVKYDRSLTSLPCKCMYGYGCKRCSQ